MKVDRLADSVGGVSIGPLKGSGAFVIGADVAHEFAFEVGFGSKNPSGDQVALDLGKPEFDLVEPGGVGGRKVQTDVRMLGKEVCDAFGFVGGEVVGNEMDLFAFWLGRDHVAQKGDEFGAGVAGRGLPQHLAAGSVEGGVERESAMAKIFKTMSLGSTGRKRQDGIEPVEGLNGRLLIHTEDNRVSRRPQVERNHLGRFALKVGVVAAEVMAAPMRLQTHFGPDSRNAHMICPQNFSQFATAPVGRSRGRLAIESPVDDARFELLGAPARPSATMATVEPAQALGAETIAPQLHRVYAATLLPAHFAQALARGQSKQDATAPNLLQFAGSTPAHFHQHTAFGRAKCDPFRHIRTVTYMSQNSMIQCTRKEKRRGLRKKIEERR